MKPESDFSHMAVRSLFLRGIGLVYLLAFLSLGNQVEGLFGASGLSPVTDLLTQLREQLGGSDFFRLPTVLWFGSSNPQLVVLCHLGAIAGLLLLLGLLPLPAAFVAWLLYLSFVVAGAPFLRFQWDSLLLESGFLALLWAPGSLTLRGGAAERPSQLVLWLIRILVFRVMFLSGFVKLASHDPSWWDLSALRWHYWTQPLPAWTAWYAAKLPLAFQQVSSAIVFAIELLLPFAIFVGPRARRVACGGFVALMVLIGATGNYGFFNLLAVVLCIPLLHDADLPRFLRQPPSPRRVPTRLRRTITAIAAFLVLAQSVPTTLARVTGMTLPLEVVRESLLPVIGPFQLTSTYGLFAAMTKQRPELILEASHDDVTWQPYVFRFKPGPPARRPPFIGFGMPRLDWQLWFDALSIERAIKYRVPPGELVLPSLIRRLKEADPHVLALLEASPFGNTPPRSIRWQLPRYRFTTTEERAATGNWWHVEPAS